MKEMLLELLMEYKEKLEQNKNECILMIKNGVSESKWQEHAKKGAGLKLMIEKTLIELSKYKD